MIDLEDIIGFKEVSIKVIEVLNNYIGLLNKYGAYSEEERTYFTKIHNNFPKIKPLMIKALEKKELFDQGYLL